MGCRLYCLVHLVEHHVLITTHSFRCGHKQRPSALAKTRPLTVLEHPRLYEAIIPLILLNFIKKVTVNKSFGPFLDIALGYRVYKQIPNTLRLPKGDETAA